MTVTLRSACYYVTCVHVNTYDEFLFYSGCQCYFLYVYIWLYKINIHILWGVWVIQLLGLAILLFDDGMHCASDQHPKLAMYFHCYGYYLPPLEKGVAHRHKSQPRCVVLPHLSWYFILVFTSSI